MTEATQNMKLFNAANMSIYNSLNKMNSQCNSNEPISLSLVYDKVFQNSYKANEGLYTVSYNFVNQNYKV